MAKHRIYSLSVASVYPHYLAKAEKKGRTKAEVDEVIRWLTGYTSAGLAKQLKNQTDFEKFFAQAPRLNPLRTQIKGVICGVRIEAIEDPLMREVRYLDKLVDELAKGWAMEKILRASPAKTSAAKTLSAKSSPRKSSPSKSSLAKRSPKKRGAAKGRSAK